MKKCIISLNLLYYIIFFHRFNGVESQSASLSTGQPTSGTAAVDSGSTNPPVTTTITPITLDISKSKDTNEFNYKKDGKFRTYTPKPGNVFTKIVKKPIIGSGVDIWSAKHNDNALKAVLMGSGKDDPKYLSILLQSGNFVLLRKRGKNKPWVDLTADKQDVTKLKFLGDNDTELTSSDYKVDLVDLSFTFLFKANVNCKKVTYNNTPLWSHIDDTNFSEIKSLSLDLPTNSFFVKNQSDQTKELTKAKVSVDVNASQSGSTPTTPQGTPPTTPPPPGTPTSGSGEGTDRLRSSGSTPNSGSGEGTDRSRSSGSTPNSGSGEGTDKTGSGRPTNDTQQSNDSSGPPSDYEKFLDQLLQQQSKDPTPTNEKPSNPTTPTQTQPPTPETKPVTQLTQ